MSYILDALRRAQAERERGQVPGLDARTLVETSPPPAPQKATALWLGGALALCALAVAAVLMLRGEAGPAAAPTLSAEGPATLRAPAVVPVPVNAPAAPSPMVVVSAPAVPPPVLVGSAAPLPALVVPPTPTTGPAVAPAQPVLAPPASNVRAVQLAQLSPDLRRELPPLVLGGAIWSDNAASRFVIVNGQVLREGDVAGPGVVLERIAQKAVFLRWRDWRIEVPI